MRPYQARRTGQEAAVPEPEPGEQRDERGLTRWHYLHDRQVICGTCHCSPCADACPEQWKLDRLEWKAARANLTVARWAAAHTDWMAAHAGRPDVAASLESQRTRLQTEQPATAQRRIPVEAAMAQAMAVVVGEARAEDMAPVYEEVEAP